MTTRQRRINNTRTNPDEVYLEETGGGRTHDNGRGINKITGERVDGSWISATSTYNYMMKDPLLDWLKRHGGALTHRTSFSGKHRDIVNMNAKSEDYNFTSYIMGQGTIFEKKVMKLITKKFGSDRVAEIRGEEDPRNPDKVKETLDAMKRGVPIIHSGVVQNPENRTFGVPDLIIRSDWIKYIVRDCPICPREAAEPAVKLGSEQKGRKWHYRVVDIKFTGLLLRADATHLLNSASFPAYKAQLLVYNWALGYMQGYTPDQAYILGRRWKYTAKAETHFCDSCFDKLAVIDYRGQDKEYVEQTNNALSWIREVHSEGAAQWNIMDYPLHRWELYPNMCNHHDYPWRTVKEHIASQNNELTSLWMVGPKNRNLALHEGIFRWTDKDCTPGVLGVKGAKTGRILKQIMAINRNSKERILPSYVSNNIGSWKQKNSIEFFVDFETCNGVVSSIKRLPIANTETLIFMIGVGYIDPDTHKWVYRHFTVDMLTFSEEERICRSFSDFIVEKSYQYNVSRPRCIHWSQAEQVMWDRAVSRHHDVSDHWQSSTWDWVDLLLVFKEEPIVIKGCLSFGLKDVASAMKQHGFIESSWDKNGLCVDGKSAMIAARKAYFTARKSGTTMAHIPVMKQIIKYNKIDVRVLYEMLCYLRSVLISPPPKRSRKEIEPPVPYPPRKRHKGDRPEPSERPSSVKHNTLPHMSILKEMNSIDNTITPMNTEPRYNFRERR